MRRDNYEIAKDGARALFLNYDVEAILRTREAEGDANALYLTFIGRRFRIDRADGRVELLGAGGEVLREANYREALTIYDVLCYENGPRAIAGRWTPLSGLAPLSGQGGGDEELYGPTARFFAGRQDALRSACRALGGTPEGKGDVAYRIELWPGFDALFEFWDADDEFPPTAQIMWDANTIRFVHYETVWYIAGCLLTRLRELAGEGAQA